MDAGSFTSIRKCVHGTLATISKDETFLIRLKNESFRITGISQGKCFLCISTSNGQRTTNKLQYGLPL